MEETTKPSGGRRLDLPLMLIPFVVICGIGSTFFIWPEGATNTLTAIRGFINVWFSSWICLLGIAAVVLSIVLAFSRWGNIVLGKEKKPLPWFQWGAIVFTTSMAADLLYFGIVEWSFYADDPYLGTLGGVIQDWIPTMSLFHWGPTAWSFLLVLAVAYGFMMHVRGRRSRKLSEACRPLLGSRVDGPLGRAFDLLAIFALYASVAASFAVSIPMIGASVGELFGFEAGIGTFVAVTLLVCGVYTVSACVGMKSISWFSKACVWLFLGLLAYVFVFSGRSMFLLETAITCIGNLANNFLKLSTQLDPMRENFFPQNWTLFYWAYWLTWGVGPPFFIAQVSGGRTVRQVILEGYAWGVAGGWVAFLIMGNYGMSLQLIDGMPLTAAVAAGAPTTMLALEILKTLPLPKLVIALSSIVMTLLLTTSMDSTALIAGAFSEPTLRTEELPSRRGRLFWAVLLIVLPLALLFAEGSLDNIQSVTIIAALPLSVILILCTVSFFKDSKVYLREQSSGDERK